MKIILIKIIFCFLIIGSCNLLAITQPGFSEKGDEYSEISLEDLIEKLEKATQLLNKQRKNLILEVTEWDSGFFSCFRAVMGALDYYEKNKSRSNYANFQINFFGGLYLDPDRGPNWWEYYFEPINTASSDNQGTTDYGEKIPMGKIRDLAHAAGSSMSKERAFELIHKYIRIKPHIQQKVDAYVDEHFKNNALIGIHYRGTDKIAEAPRVPYEQVYKALRRTIDNLTNGNYKIFVATDEQEFLEDITKKFDNVIYYNCLRSANDKPLHYSKVEDNMIQNSNPYQLGEDALIDCLLLSKCHFLLRTQSNLSSAAMDFNPIMQVLTLNHSNDRYAR